MLTLGPFSLATRALGAHQPNWIQTNLAPRGETKPVGSIESFGAPPQTPGQLRRKYVAGARPPDPVGAPTQTPFRRAHPRAVQPRYARPPAKLDSDKFGSWRRDQTGWLD
ncbi:MAG: hypothetical protein GY696_16980, partial [Gammaproteobacteria bacterium]|nr:hypothetical protein [Gammaproteobacteria bacterium]